MAYLLDDEDFQECLYDDLIDEADFLELDSPEVDFLDYPHDDPIDEADVLEFDSPEVDFPDYDLEEVADFEDLRLDLRKLTLVTKSGLPEGYKNSWYNGPGVPLTNPNHCTMRCLDFYNRRSNIPEYSFKIAYSAVDEILNDILLRANKLREPQTPIIGEFLRCGSSCEGVKSVRPDEFDVIVPLEINERAHGCSYKVLTNKDDRSIPAGFAMCKLTGRPAGQLRLMCKTGATHTGTFISLEELILGWFHRLLYKAIRQRGNEGKNCRVEVKKKKGPSLVLIITSEAFEAIGTKKIKVDVVPAVKLDPSGRDTRFIVATKLFSDYHYFEHKYGTDLKTKLRQDFQLYWRVSMTFHERAHFVHLEDRLGADSCHIACLKFLKAKRWMARSKENHDEKTICWKYISSYMLKTALFWTIQAKTRKEDWDWDVMFDRIQDILKYVGNGFKKGVLPNFFYNNKSLVYEFPEDIFFREENDCVNLVYQGAERIRNRVTQSLREVRHRLKAKYNAVRPLDGESDISDTGYQRYLLGQEPEDDQDVDLSTDCDPSCRSGRRSQDGRSS